MFNKINLSQEKTKDFIAGLIALIFVVTAGYLALNRFNNSESREMGIGGEATITENGDASSERTNDETVVTNGMIETGSESASWESTVSYWVANDYNLGDIQSGNYTVVNGDTLWEIAEGVYGDGSRWGEILNANAGDVGYLPTGSQALIYAGQVLMIP